MVREANNALAFQVAIRICPRIPINAAKEVRIVSGCGKEIDEDGGQTVRGDDEELEEDEEDELVDEELEEVLEHELAEDIEQENRQVEVGEGTSIGGEGGEGQPSGTSPVQPR